MRTRVATRLGLAGCALGLIIGAAGCGGGDGEPDAFRLRITDCDTTTYAAQGVVCVEFRTTGFLPGTYSLLAQYATASPLGPLATATQIPPGLANQLGLPILPPILTPQSKTDPPQKFCWFAGADLGFVRTLGVVLSLTPVAPGTTDPIAAPDFGCLFNYFGGGQTQLFSGPGIGNLGGRARHCGEHIVANNIVIAGGVGPLGLGVGVYDTVDRLTLDPATFTYTKNPSPLLMRSPRVNHACSFFLDPANGTVKVLVTGGDASIPASVPSATADIYSFTPTDQVMSTGGSMNVPRRDHTATWIPSNKVVIIGGSSGTAALCSMEIWDPLVGTFQLLSVSLAFCRQDHTATLLPSGKILVAGGYDPAVGAALPAELVDPVAGTVMTVPGPLVDRIGHTATRLANGWVLLAGGFLATSLTTVTASSQVFEPELGAMGQFTTLSPLMNSPRALHAASLLGDGHALVTGGLTSGTLCPATTQSAELFLPETLVFTPTIPMTTPRAEHTSTAISTGMVAIVGGSNDAGCVTTFLTSLEVYPFNDTNPVIASAFATPSGAGTVDVNIGVTDQDADGGYVIIRYRQGGVGMFMLATIIQQVPSTAPANFPNMEVNGSPTIAMPYSFRWNFAADGLSSGTPVEIEVLPVGATLGTPLHLNTVLP